MEYMKKELQAENRVNNGMRLNQLKTKILAFAVLMFTIPLVIVGITLWQNKKISEKNSFITEKRISGNAVGLQLLSGLNRITANQNAWLLTSDDAKVVECKEAWQEIVMGSIRQLKSQSVSWAEESSSLSAENKALLNTIIGDIEIYREQHEQILRLGKEPFIFNEFGSVERLGNELSEVLARQNQVVIKIRTSLKQLAGNQERQAIQDMEEVAALTQGQNVSLYIQLLFALLLAVSFGRVLYMSVIKPVNTLKALIKSIAEGNIPEKIKPGSDEIGEMIQASNNLIDNLNRAAEFSEAIGNGNFNSAFQTAGPADKLGNALITMRNQLQQLDAEDHKRNWITTGIARIGEILRSTSQDTDHLYNGIISFVIKYLNANQGALFVMEEHEQSEKPYMELVACYAYDRKKYINRKIEIGEGLVGQAVLEKDIIYMTDVPQGYVHITSGLGGATPGCILIVPLLINDEVFGALELASLQPFEPYQVEFVKKIAESIASVIASSKTNKRTSQLLQSTQFQAEELRAQEEEMRQNMEELSATQEEMKRMMLEVQAQTNIINSVAIVSKTDLRGNITYVNDEFLKWSKYTMEEVMGRNHRFLKSGDQDDAIFQELWKTISKGKIFRGEIKNKAKDGSFYWVDAIIAPVLGEDGKPKEYIAQRFVINNQKEKERLVEETLKKARMQEEETRMLADNITGAVFKATYNGIDFAIEYVSSGIEVITGYTADELQQNSRLFRSLVVPEGRMLIEKALKGAMQYGSDYEVEYTLSTKNGVPATVRETAKIGITGTNGYVIVTGYIEDVSREKESATEIQSLLESAEQQNRQLKEQEEELLENLRNISVIQEDMRQRAIEIEGRLNAINESGIASIEFNLDGTIVNANSSFLHLMGYTLDEIVGKHHRIFVAKEDQESAAYQKFWQDLREGLAQPGAYKRFNRNGEEVYIKGAYSIISDAKGNPYRILKLATDLSNSFHNN
jgi:PAS domain S-box-containing protein